MSLLYRPEGMSPEAFLRHWTEVHGPMVRAMPGVRRYVQDHVVDTLLRDDAAMGPPHPDGLSEIWFDSRDALEAAFASPAGQAALADTANFIGRATTVVVAEKVVIPGK